MTNIGTWALSAAGLLFIGFFANVTAGAMGIGVFLGDVPEMLTLFAAVICFVIGVLIKEKSTADP